MKIKNVIITVVLIVAVIGAAVLGYNYLSEEYAPEQSQEQESDRAKALDFTVQDENGNSVALSDFAGKPIVVNFWATWCGPCKMEMPYFQSAYEKYGEDVVFLMVNVDGGAAPAANVTEFLAEGGYRFPVFFDTNYSASMAYAVDAIPETVFITADGEISYKKIGVITESQLNAEIQRIIQEAK